MISLHVNVMQMVKPKNANTLKLNVVVIWLTFLLRIRELWFQFLAQKPPIRTEVFVFSSIPPSECWDSAFNYATTSSFQISSNSSILTLSSDSVV
jgi:hypothetical protein